MGDERPHRMAPEAPRSAEPRRLAAWRFDFGGESFAPGESPRRPPGATALLAALSPAELQVTRLVAAGHPNAEIARRRGSAVRTVANQVASAFRKLGVGSRLELWALLARGGSRIVGGPRVGRAWSGAPPASAEETSVRALTPRQRSVLAYAALGHQNKFIGHLLGLSASAVAFHLESVRRKLGLASRAELVWRFAPLLDRGAAPGPERQAEAGRQCIAVSNESGGGSAFVPSAGAVQGTSRVTWTK